MFKTTRLRITGITIIPFIALSFSGRLQYRDVFAGQIKMLMPVELSYVPKSSYTAKQHAEHGPDEMYSNKDQSVAIAFMKLPHIIHHFSKVKQMSMEVLADSTSKIYFNDTTIVNGNKTYVLNMDKKEESKMKYIKAFMMNTREDGVICLITCNLPLKKTWLPIFDQILKSVKVN